MIDIEINGKKGFTVNDSGEDEIFDKEVLEEVNKQNIKVKDMTEVK